MSKNFDILVIGSGPGGYPAAIRAAQRGKKVGLIESGDLGGTCLNRGCIPSKALIAGAEVLKTVLNASEFGIETGNIHFNYEKMVERKDRIVNKIRKNLEGLILANDITIIRGFAEFISAKEIKVKSEIYTAEKIILATGSEPRDIAAFPFDHEFILNSTDILNLKKLPKKMAIIGGGVIGCEFASLYQILGVEITAIEMLGSLLPMEAPSLSSFLTKNFQARGIHIETNAKVTNIHKINGGVTIELDTGKHFSADIALVSIGRKMNLEGLEKLGLKLINPNEVSVNEKMETNIPGFYAIGDIASKWWLAHVATHQGIVAADNACGLSAKMHYEAIPNVIFTTPEMATVGLSLEEAKEKGFQATLSQFPFQALGKSLAAHHVEGFSQIVIEPSTGRILGAQVIGYEASSLISELTLAIQNELTIECIQETIHAHPTLPESWLEAAFLATHYPLHLPPKKIKK